MFFCNTVFWMELASLNYRAFLELKKRSRVKLRMLGRIEFDEFMKINKMMRIRTLTFIILICVTLSCLDGQSYLPNEYACPVTPTLFPEKKQHDCLLAYTFAQNSVAKRISISLVGTPDRQYVDVKFTWIGEEGWGERVGVFCVKVDGNPNCYFLGIEANIPENIPLKEFRLQLPTGVHLKELSFSSLPSELVSVTCPMPQLEKEIKKAFRDWQSHPEDEDLAQKLIGLLQKTIPRYDCRRAMDYKPVPAWWLADDETIANSIGFMKALLDAKSASVLRLFMEFYDTSDGYIAVGLAGQIMKMLNSDPMFILMNWDVLKEYKESIFGVRYIIKSDDVAKLTTLFLDIGLAEPNFKSICEEIIEGLRKK